MQPSFSELEYASKRKVTRRDRFLSEIEAITPWVALEAELEAFYPKGGGTHWFGADVTNVCGPTVLWLLGRRH